MNPDLFTILLAVFAAARLTRLVVDDTISAPVVGAIVRWADRTGGDKRARWWNSLLSCWYCVGVYVSAAIVAAYAVLPLAWFQWLCAIPALSYALVALGSVVEE